MLVVTKFKVLYGLEYLTHNIHNLLYLAHEVNAFASLEFSCVKFENHMSNIVNRVFEENSLPVKKEVKKAYPIIKYITNSSKIKMLEFDGFTSGKEKTNCVYYQFYQFNY